MKQYIKPQTSIIELKMQHHLLEPSTTMKVNTTESHSASESFSRRGNSYWDDEE